MFGVEIMPKKRHLAIYWDEERHADLMDKFERLAKKQERSKSATALVAIKQFVEKHWGNGEEGGEESKKEVIA